VAVVTTRVLLTDDDPLVRAGLSLMLGGSAGLEIVGEAANGQEAVDRVRRGGVDVVLMDLRMPGMSGVQAIAALRERAPAIRVLVVTTFDSEADVLPAIEAGATGYLLKDATPDELLRAVHAAHAGESTLAPSVVGQLMGRVRRPSGPALSKRELEVLRHVADGAANREVARRLFISEASVKTHLLHIYDKLGVRDRAAAVGEAYRRGLLT
jgi:DNA-binding NarL/FixJ family response regulator